MSSRRSCLCSTSHAGPKMSVADGGLISLEGTVLNTQHVCLSHPPELSNSNLVNISSASCRGSHSPSLVLPDLCFCFFRLPAPPLPGLLLPERTHQRGVLCCLELPHPQALAIKRCYPEVPPLPKCSRMCFVQFSQLLREALGGGVGGPVKPTERKRGRG